MYIHIYNVSFIFILNMINVNKTSLTPKNVLISSGSEANLHTEKCSDKQREWRPIWTASQLISKLWEKITNNNIYLVLFHSWQHNWKDGLASRYRYAGEPHAHHVEEKVVCRNRKLIFLQQILRLYLFHARVSNTRDNSKHFISLSASERHRATSATKGA